MEMRDGIRFRQMTLYLEGSLLFHLAWHPAHGMAETSDWSGESLACF